MTWSRGTKFAELDGKYGSGTSKNNRILSECLKSLYLLCPTASFAIQLGGFYTIGPSHAKGLLDVKPKLICLARRTRLIASP